MRTLSIFLFVLTLANSQDAAILESRTDEIGRGAEFAKSKGGSENNKLELVNAPVRGQWLDFLTVVPENHRPYPLDAMDSIEVI